MAAARNKRTAVLGVIAIVLVAATIYDYTIGGPGRKNSDEPASAAPVTTHVTQASGGGVETLLREAEELSYFISRAPRIRSRYIEIAGPYAETVATFATLYQHGENPAAVAKQRLSQLLPPEVSMKELLIAEAPANSQGALPLVATLTLDSGDSAAFQKAIFTLGNAANGTLWKELYLSADPEKRHLKASGQLAMLMVEQAE